ncbi:hypothetical protein COEREDRAFT_79856 [Coemansia reversa NRRL 1564]|uniref:Uncharacterized protein n=1 Tax=Coemansia reversa (strain ATCC 12441 / NRRL 1564) TaxID=763665 RepID=A0A2G5BHB5_COERN|nr:hypothetical protein COEREDRAFT_79856 [Coemansia reversa NRRL 1564]|eukprot:PIA18381.1 hypothetical protein COEREDRAFT_79856 [Coemansia reversa NRRL 1564]
MYAQQQQSQQQSQRRQTGISHDIVNSDAETNRPSDGKFRIPHSLPWLLPTKRRLAKLRHQCLFG